MLFSSTQSCLSGGQCIWNVLRCVSKGRLFMHKLQYICFSISITLNSFVHNQVALEFRQDTNSNSQSEVRPRLHTCVGKRRGRTRCISCTIPQYCAWLSALARDISNESDPRRTRKTRIIWRLPFGETGDRPEFGDVVPPTCVWSNSPPPSRRIVEFRLDHLEPPDSVVTGLCDWYDHSVIGAPLASMMI